MPATVTDYVLALATLGDATQIGSSLFYAEPPKAVKASALSVAATGIIVLNFANENTPLDTYEIK